MISLLVNSRPGFGEQDRIDRNRQLLHTNHSWSTVWSTRCSVLGWDRIGWDGLWRHRVGCRMGVRYFVLFRGNRNSKAIKKWKSGVEPAILKLILLFYMLRSLCSSSRIVTLSVWSNGSNPQFSATGPILPHDPISGKFRYCFNKAALNRVISPGLSLQRNVPLLKRLRACNWYLGIIFVISSAMGRAFELRSTATP